MPPKELYKYDFRAEVFLRKYKAKEKFTLTTGAKVTFVPNKAIIAAVEARDPEPLKSIGLIDTAGNHYTFGKLEKTKEFGGKGAGSGTTKEDIELSSLQKQINDLKVELGRATVPMKVGTKTYQVAGAASTAGTPKSDFHLIDDDGNEIVWISHKDGSKANDFQQWGGMTEASIASQVEIKKFIADLIKEFDGAIPRATTVARKIKSTKLKNMSVYGVEYGRMLGQQNVSILIQGPVKIIKSGRVYKFDSNHIHFNGDRITGDFVPVMMAVYKGDRSQFGLKGARFTIQPLGSRKITRMV